MKKYNIKYIYGKNPALLYLEQNKGRKMDVYVTNSFYEREKERLLSYDVKIHQFNSYKLEKIVHNSHHQGIVVKCLLDNKTLDLEFDDSYERKEIVDYYDLEKVIEESTKKSAPLIIILDQVQDPHNFGAIIRTAAATKVDAIIVQDRNQAPVTNVVVKASAGTISQVKLVKVTNIANTLEILKNNGFWIFASDSNNESIDLKDSDVSRPSAIILGNEGSGVRQLVLKKSDYTVKIPMNSRIESLNVSVATAVLLYYFRLNNKNFSWN